MRTPVANRGSKIAAYIDECGECEPPSTETLQAAARLVCANARGATREEQVADASELMAMLGLMPGQEDEYYLTGPAIPVNRDCPL